MKYILLLYLKVFVIMSVGFGGLSYLLDLPGGARTDLQGYILKGVFFGLLMSLLLVSSHWRRLKAIGVKDINKEILGVRHAREITSSLSMEDLEQKLVSDPEWSRLTMKREGDTIHLTSGISVWSFGEHITITLADGNDDNYTYKVTSRPRLSTTILDNGKNLEHVWKIEKGLNVASS